MAPEDSTKSIQSSKEELDVISNRISLALAKHDNLVKSWTVLSAKSKAPEKTQEELDAEDTALFRNAPSHLGVGALVPSHFLVSDAERNNKSLRAKFFPIKGSRLKSSKDEEGRSANTKRGLVEDSSDEEEGRSSLGKAKKQKPLSNENKEKSSTKGKSPEKQVSSLAIPLETTPKNTTDTAARGMSHKGAKNSRHSGDEAEAATIPELKTTLPKPAADAKREKMRQRKAWKRSQKKKNKAQVV